MSDSQLIQFKPARAKKKIIIEELPQHHSRYTCYDEQKIDGERYIIQTNRKSSTPQYPHGVTSRRISTVTDQYVEKADRVPHIASAPIPGQNMLDSEFVSSGDLRLVDLPDKFWDKLMQPNHPHSIWLKDTYQGQLPVYPHVGNTVSIMGSLGPEAVEKQKQRGLIWAYCFDLLQLDARSALGLPQIRRRELLASLLEPLDPQDGIILMPAWHSLTLDELTELFYIVTDIPNIPGETDGGEGLIRKLYDEPYNAANAWWKLKKDYPADCVLTGDYKMGNEGVSGKMLGLVGSLSIGVYLDGRLEHIGWMSAIMDSEGGLERLTDDAVNGRLRGRVYECRHNGLQAAAQAPCGYTLRHPRARRPREDKNVEECTWQALYDEVKRVGVI